MYENLKNYRISFFDENFLAQITTATLLQILAKAAGQSQSACQPVLCPSVVLLPSWWISDSYENLRNYKKIFDENF